MTVQAESLRRHVAGYLEQHRVHACAIVVAVSGGLDSVALLHCLWMCRQRFALSLHVVHVHHGLRGQAADEDEAFVRTLADALGVSYHCLRVDVAAEQARRTNATVEAVARELRYAALEQVATSVNATAIVVAHTADDVAETFLMHLARGSGAAGLGALTAVRHHGDYHLLRPFHAIERSQIDDEARHHGWTWRTDQTNTNTQYLRNNVRHTVVPALRTVFGDGIVRAIHHSAEILRDTSTLLEHALTPLVADLVQTIDGGMLLRASVLDGLHPALLPEILRRCTRPLAPYPLSRVDLDRILSLLHAEVGTQATLRQGLMALRDRDGLMIMRNHRDRGQHGSDDSSDDRTTSVHVHRGTQSLDGQALHVVGTAEIADITAEDFVWRYWQPGDRLDGRPVRSIISAAGMPHRLRRTVTVLCRHGQVLWICGVPSHVFTYSVGGENLTFTHVAEG